MHRIRCQACGTECAGKTFVAAHNVMVACHGERTYRYTPRVLPPPRTLPLLDPTLEVAPSSDVARAWKMPRMANRRYT